MVAKRTDGFRAEAKGKTLNLYIYDEIAPWEVSAKDVADALADAPSATTINVYINSPGGSVWGAFAIYNQLRRAAANVVVYVDGVAASSASVVAMAGDEIIMAANAYMMIHNPTVFAIGDADDLRYVVEKLDRFRATIAAMYVARTGNSTEQITAWMDEETWFDATEAKEHGFADTVAENKEVKNDFDWSVFNNTPPSLMPQARKRPLAPRGYSRQAIESIVAGFPEVFGSEPSDVDRKSDNKQHPANKENAMAAKTALTETDVETRLAEAQNKWTAEAKTNQEKALTEARNKWAEEATASQEKAVTEAVNKVAKDTTAAVRDGIKDVLARCEIASISLADARDMIERDISLEDAKDEVIKAQAARNKSVGDGGGSDPGAKKDPTAKYRAEFKAAGGESEVGVSEEDYIASRVRDDAGGVIE